MVPFTEFYFTHYLTGLSWRARWQTDCKNFGALSFTICAPRSRLLHGIYLQ